MITLRRGDSRTLNISGLVDSAGDPMTFLAGDAARFTIRRHDAGTFREVIIAKSTDFGGGVALDIGQATGTVTITPEDWTNLPGPEKRATVRAVCDLELTRGDDVWTVFTAQVNIEPDVSQ